MIIIERLKLKELIAIAIKKLQDEKYRQDTVDDYNYVWKRFYDMCEVFNIEYFDYQTSLKFLEKYYHIDTKNGSGRNYSRRMRAMYILNCINKGQKIGLLRRKVDKYIPECYRGILNEYEEYLVDNNYKKQTIYGSNSALIKFFCFLEEKKIFSINSIHINDIYSFVNSIDSKKYSLRTISYIKYRIKLFFDYLYNIKQYKFSGVDIFPKIVKYDRSKLPSYYTTEEINKMIKQVNTNTKKGKRDLAILLLASVYGLRTSDIIHLKKENIKWNQNKIELIQYKTKVLLELPLTENVKFALLDYMKNARINVDSDYIFLPVQAPYKYINGDNYSFLYKSMSEYAKKAGIYNKNKKLGLHSLRHSAASNMLKNNADITTISSILGHKSIDVTNVYLSISIDQLRKLSLEVPIYE